MNLFSKMHFCYCICANIHKHYHCAFQFFILFFFPFLEDKGREWMIVVVCEDREIIFKDKKI